MEGSQRLEVLDSWRGIAALMVALLHFDAFSHIYDLPLLRNSMLFVDFFFVLSGFVIAGSYEDKLRQGFSYSSFLLLRFGRLFPLHFAILMAMVAYECLKYSTFAALGGSAGEAFSYGFSLPKLLSNLALVQSLGLHDTLSWNVPSWSISTEFYAYAAFAFIVIFCGRAYKWIILATIGLSVYILANVAPRGIYSNWDYGFARCLFGFLIGTFVWQAYQFNKRTDRQSGSQGAGSQGAGSQGAGSQGAQGDNRRLWNLFEVLCLALIILFLSSLDELDPAGLMVPFLFALCVFVFAQEKGFVSGILRHRIFVGLGTYSYSIYMVHFFLTILFHHTLIAIDLLFDVHLFAANGHFGSSLLLGDLFTLIYLAAVIAVSHMTYHVIEAPSRRYFRRLVEVRETRLADDRASKAGYTS